MFRFANHDQLLDSLRVGSSSSAAAAVQSLISAAVHLQISPADDAKISIGASKMGGNPDSPNGTAWPDWQGTPLAFVLQIHLPDLNAFSATKALPQSGTLSFFYEGGEKVFGDQPTDQGAWRVLYFDNTDLHRLPPPKNPTAQFKSCTVTFSAVDSLPQQPALYKPAIKLTADVQTKYENWWLDQQHAAKTPDHRLFGYAADIQDDMHSQVQALVSGLKSDDPKAAATAQSGTAQNDSEWVLLLQLDSDESIDMRWGSDGMIYWWIERAKLTAHDFSRVWLILQSE